MKLPISRGRVSTFLISLLHPVAGLLWIGRAKLAVAVFLLHGGAIVVFCVKLPQFAAYGLLSLMTALLSIGVALAVGICTLRTSTVPKWYSNGFIVALTVVVYTTFATLGIRIFLIQPFEISSASMAPALVSGDGFFASKSAYGYSRHSAPYDMLPIQGRIFAAEPQRGDVVVFTSSKAETYVKRVVGLPGEAIQMINGVPNIDGVPVQTEEAESSVSPEAGSFTGISYRETLPNGVSYMIIRMTDNAPGDNTMVYNVPAGHYFLLGDNRNNSDDSRFSLGMVPFENLIGKAVWIYANSEGADYSDRQRVGAKQGS